MDYFQEIKPTLNKLSKYNVFESLEVISRYIRAIVNNKDKRTIIGIESPEYNSIEIFFSDFLIINSIIYSSEFPAKLSLQRIKDRYKIIKPVSDLCDKINLELSHNEPLVWIVTYIFNQTNINVPGCVLIKFFRYYYIYNSVQIRKKLQSIYGFSLDHYFRAALFLYSAFANNHIEYSEADLLKTKFKDQSYIKALKLLLSEISINLGDLRELCKDYLKYESDKIFNHYNDAPHVCYPLIKHQDKYFCTIPTYIISALLDGLYYKLDIPNSILIRDEFADNLEKYVGLLLKKAITGENILYRPEITYTDGKQGSQKTSDWILWDKDAICFLDCKTKTISIKGKRATEIDDEMIAKIISMNPYTKRTKQEYIDVLEDGITKDLINYGIDLGKVFVSYHAYEVGKIPELTIKSGKEFYACLVTIEENYINTPEFKKRIIQIAQSYYEYKLGAKKVIDETKVKLLSVGNLEASLERISVLGIGRCLEESPIINNDGVHQIKDYLIEECKKTLFNPLINDIHK